MVYAIKQLLRFSLPLFLLCLPIQSAFAGDALIIRGKSENFDEVVRGIYDDVEGEVLLHELIVKTGASVKQIEKRFGELKPDLVILIGNKAVNLYIQFQLKNSEMKFPPAIAVAALFIDQFAKKLKNATAIRYEIPAVTSAVTMRTVLDRPVKKLGVIYREWMDDIFKENRRYCQSEGIELIGIKLPNKSGNMEIRIKRALNRLNKKVDALWIINDNSLLTSKSIAEAWLPLRKQSKIPAIVGIKLFMTRFPLGSFAIVPDDYALGAQTAGMIFEIMENDWLLEGIGIQHPLSTRKYINTKTLDKKEISYQSVKLLQFDDVIK